MAITSGNHYNFLFGTKAQYAAALAAEKISADNLYFLTDTKQIYIGTDLYAGNVQFGDIPSSSNASQGVVYCNPTTHETKVWNGSSWNVIVPAVQTSINASSNANDGDLANIGAIKSFVSTQIGSAYTITKATTADTGYAATYQLFKGDTAVGDKINIPKDMVVESGSVKSATAADVTAEIYPGVTEGDLYIDLVIANATDQHIYIPVNSLVEFPTVDDTASVDLSIDAGHKITADIKLSDNAGNILSTVETAGHQGLFAEHYVGSIEDTKSVDLDVTNKKLTANVKRSATTGNKLTEENDGLYVAPDYIGSITDSNSIDLDVTSAALSASVKLSDNTGNILSTVSTSGHEGLFAEHYIGSIDDTSTVDLTVSNKQLSAAVKLSATADNIITAESDGLYARGPVWSAISAS